MIVYDLKCRKGHAFEAWFRDSAAYDEQAESGKVSCPACGSRRVEKALMAPRLSRSGSRGGGEEETSKAVETRRALEEIKRKVEENCDYVGGEFAEEARRIHYGETDARSIYGETSDEEATALSEEGVPFGRVPWPARQDS